MSFDQYPFTFSPNKKGLRKILGDLEAEIMDVIWAKDETTVRQVYDALKNKRSVAYTTVMTVMSRLAEKGLLTKVRQGAAFTYKASSSREQFTQSTVKRVLSELLEDFTAPALSQFVEALGEEEPGKMEELARLIEEKRKAQNG